jgi:hypothetical protein
MLAVQNGDRPVGGFEIVEQPRVDGDAPALAIPLAIALKVRAVGIEVAASGGAEMIVHRPGIPAVDRVAVGQGHLELIRPIIGVEMTAF